MLPYVEYTCQVGRNTGRRMSSLTSRHVRRQNGGGGVIFWNGIIGNELASPFLVSDDIEQTAAAIPLPKVPKLYMLT